MAISSQNLIRPASTDEAAMPDMRWPVLPQDVKHRLGRDADGDEGSGDGVSVDEAHSSTSPLHSG